MSSASDTGKNGLTVNDAININVTPSAVESPVDVGRAVSFPGDTNGCRKCPTSLL
jgi:hypothetical protein